MRTIPFFIFLLSFLLCFSCGKKMIDIKVKEEYRPEQPMHFSSQPWQPGDTMSIYHHLEDIAYKENDSIKVIQMAQNDAECGAYFFMVIGLLAYPEMDDTHYNKTQAEQKKLCTQHNIWIFSMGCDGSEMGLIYNREMKKLLKKNKGLDYDSHFDPPLATL